MITVITGQPGNGKTLFALGLVEELRAKSQLEGKTRPVFYSGVPELMLPWSELPAATTWAPEGAPSSFIRMPCLEWMSVPDGALVFIDECQRVFPPRKQGAAVPPHIQALETHRHRGIDLYFITQHPQLVDIAVRKLAGRHIHVTRTFGQDAAKVRQWERCVDPHDRSVQSLALVSGFNFPRERFGWYKSAEIHTVKKELPWKKFALLVGCLVGIIGFGWLAWSMLAARGEDQAELAATGKGTITGTTSSSPASSRNFGPGQLQPVLKPWLWSAPFYDVVTKVQSAPRVSGCYSHLWSDGRLECKCSTQQGTVASISRDECMQQLQRGLFDPIRADQDPKAYNVARLDARDANASSAGTTSVPPEGGAESAALRPSGGS